MRGFPGFVGNLETTVILVRVADCRFVTSSLVPRSTLVGNFWPGNETNMTVGGGDCGPHDNKEGKSVLSVVATVHAICYRKGDSYTPHYNNDDERPRGFSEVFPEGEMGAMQQ